MMKKHPLLALSLLALYPGLTVVACGSDGGGDTPMMAGTGSTSGTTGMGGTGMGGTAGTGGTMGGTAGTTAGTAGTAGASGGGGGGAGGGAGTAGTSGAAATAGTGGTGMTCDLPAFEVFARSDTDQEWDDNDFSDVVLSGTCPVLVDAVWPHEEGWENADPAEANHESTHFTIDSYYSGDLTGKRLNLTIELTADERGPNATAGSYIVSIVSVSTYDRVVVVDDGGDDDDAASAGGAGGDAPMGGAPGDNGDAGAGGVGVIGAGGAGEGVGGAGGAGEDEGPMTVTETGYTEAESPEEDRAILRYVGDRATVRLTLPDKTAEVDSFDPARVIKINFRVRSAYANVSDDPGEDEGMMGAGGAGDMPEGSGGASDGGAGGAVGAGGAAGAGEGDGTPDAGGVDGMDGDPPEPTPMYVYDYLTSQFAVTNFTVTDADAP